MTNLTSRCLAACVALSAAAAPTHAQATDPGRAIDDLLAVDRRHAAAAAHLNVIDALGSMFARDVILSAAGAFHLGKDAATAQLRSLPENATARLEWAPVRAGISADGLHGFTYGFMTLVRGDSTRQPLKYLTYWVKGPEGWKAAVHRRVIRPAGDVSIAMRKPMLPAKLVAPKSEAVARFAKEVGDAERAFSNLAGKIGLGAAFTQNGAPDAMNMGGPQSADFVYGFEAIGKAVGGGEQGPSTLTWGPDTVLAASSGDLGVTIGHIVAPGLPGQPSRRIPFFTVWRKIGGVWKFVAE